MTMIQITLDVYDEYADEAHETGLTAEGYTLLLGHVGGLGSIDDVEKI